MASLKELKIRIGSVKSTQKITKAMKMVAASKLRRAQERAEAGRPYADKMDEIVSTLASKASLDNAPELLVGRLDSNGKQILNKHLIVVATSDRGLCGGFNSSITRAVKIEITKQEASGKDVSIIALGKKGYELLKSDFADKVLERLPAARGKQAEYSESQDLADKVINLFETKEIDSASIVYNKFINALVQEVTFQPLIPLINNEIQADASADAGDSVYDYEPGEIEVLEDLLPRNIAVQIYKSVLENSASEQGSRMTAMDNATRNAGEMIKALTLQFNRSRQAAITTELTEIVAGAESV